MPRRSILSAAERESLLALPDSKDDDESWNEYGQREQTRREHLSELQTVFGFRPFTMSHYRQAVQMLTKGA